MAPDRQDAEGGSSSPRKRIKLENAAASSVAAGQTPIWQSPLLDDSNELRECVTAARERRESSERKQNFSVDGRSTAVTLERVFDDKLLKKVREQLIGMKFHQRQSDLFSYSGSDDLSDVSVVSDGSPLANLRDALYSRKFVDFLQDTMGIELSDHLDLSAHIYRRGDFLACHDDDIREENSEGEGRRIAFIIYLNSDWPEEYGGKLAMYDKNTSNAGGPSDIAHTIEPVWNRMALFEVTPTSFHEVQEVLVPEGLEKDVFRLSISGWFHGPLNTRDALRGFSNKWKSNDPTIDMASFVDPRHLKPRQIVQMQKTFVETSTLEIPNFLQSNALDGVFAAIEEARRPFPIGMGQKPRLTSPPTIRRFYDLAMDLDIPGGEFHWLSEMFQTTAFREWLEGVTNLNLRAEGTRFRVHQRLFKQGCYSLIHDYGQDPVGLDVILSLGNGTTADWNPAWGGALKYTVAASALDEEEGSETEDHENDGTENNTKATGESSIPPTLFEANATPNLLTIVLRDPGVLKSIQYVNCRVKDGMKGRVDIEAVYTLPKDAMDD